MRFPGGVSVRALLLRVPSGLLTNTDNTYRGLIDHFLVPSRVLGSMVGISDSSCSRRSIIPYQGRANLSRLCSVVKCITEALRPERDPGVP